MSSAHIPVGLRRTDRRRAANRCEYCRLAESDAFFPHEPDHVIAQKHRGETCLDNLALACIDCNRFKGSDIASIDPLTGEIVPLFNPRTQSWTEHFKTDAGRIGALTPAGRATEQLLRLNLTERVEAREALAASGRYP